MGKRRNDMTSLLKHEPGPLTSGKKEVRENPIILFNTQVDLVLSAEGGGLHARGQNSIRGNTGQVPTVHQRHCPRSSSAPWPKSQSRSSALNQRVFLGL